MRVKSVVRLLWPQTEPGTQTVQLTVSTGLMPQSSTSPRRVSSFNLTRTSLSFREGPLRRRGRRSPPFQTSNNSRNLYTTHLYTYTLQLHRPFFRNSHLEFSSLNCRASDPIDIFKGGSRRLSCACQERRSGQRSRPELWSAMATGLWRSGLRGPSGLKVKRPPFCPTPPIKRCIAVRLVDDSHCVFASGCIIDAYNRRRRTVNGHHLGRPAAAL